jgi:ethanolamine utilization protein EutA (predicted chaperonin)
LDSVVVTVRTAFKAQAFRVLMALSFLASSAVVTEAGQRWK